MLWLAGYVFATLFFSESGDRRGVQHFDQEESELGGDVDSVRYSKVSFYDLFVADALEYDGIVTVDRGLGAMLITDNNC